MRVAFIVPFYKVKKEYMKQSITSIINQTYKDLEIILVDDGSPDECGAICDKYASMDERIKVIHKKNGGLSDARNAGIDIVTAEWITFVDGDDWVDENFIEQFILYISERHDLADIYYFSGYRNFPDNEVKGVPYFETGRTFSTYEERDFLQSMCLTNHVSKDGNRKGITISSAWAKIYKTDFIQQYKLKFPIVPYDEDSLFYVESIEVAKKIEYIASPVYHYRYTLGSIVNRYRPNADMEQEIYLEYLFSFAKRCEKKEDFIKKIYMRVMTSMILLIKLKYFNKNNKDSFLKKRGECNKLFCTSPYKDALNNITINQLGRNAKIKYFLLKFKFYYLLEILRRKNSENSIR